MLKFISPLQLVSTYPFEHSATLCVNNMTNARGGVPGKLS